MGGWGISLERKGWRRGISGNVKEWGGDALFDGPIALDVAAHEHLTGDDAELLVAHDFNGAVVGGQGVVEGQFFLAQSEVLAALVRLAIPRAVETVAQLSPADC